MGVVVSAMDCSRLHSIHVPDSDIGMHFGTLLENHEGSDIIFDVGGERLHAHKLVLAARSPVFRAKFFDAMEEDEHQIIVTDLEPRVFKVMYIYCFLLFCDLILVIAKMIICENTILCYFFIFLSLSICSLCPR